MSAYSLADGDSLTSETFGVNHTLLHDGLKQLLLVNTIEWGLEAKERKGRKKKESNLWENSKQIC